jgi:hypothetical protein
MAHFNLEKPEAHNEYLIYACKPKKGYKIPVHLCGLLQEPAVGAKSHSYIQHAYWILDSQGKGSGAVDAVSFEALIEGTGWWFRLS